VYFLRFFPGPGSLLTSCTLAPGACQKMVNLCSLGVWFNTLWIPDVKCPVRYFTKEEATMCLANKHVIVTGNSVSRHFFSGMLNFMRGMKEPNNDDHRNDEKKLFSGFVLSQNNSLCHTEKKMKAYAKKKSLCPYNQNYENSPHTESWQYGNNSSGKLSFMWLVDWYVPSFDSLLRENNTILTPNAGLNRHWEHVSGWEELAPEEFLKAQLPLLWNISIAPTSQLIYRLTTQGCGAEGNAKFAVLEKMMFEHAGNHSDPQKTFLDLRSPTMYACFLTNTLSVYLFIVFVFFLFFFFIQYSSALQ